MRSTSRLMSVLSCPLHSSPYVVIYPQCLSSSLSTSSLSLPPAVPVRTATQNNVLLPPSQILPTLAWLCISMPAEHVNLSHSYRHQLVKLSSDSLQQDDHRMPVAWRIRTVVTISNGGSNVLLCSHLLHCIQSAAACMAQCLPQREH